MFLFRSENLIQVAEESLTFIYKFIYNQLFPLNFTLTVDHMEAQSCPEKTNLIRNYKLFKKKTDLKI